MEAHQELERERVIGPHEDPSENGGDPESDVASAPAPGSLAERLRRQREAISEDTDFEIEVPGFNGALVARFHRDPNTAYDRVKKIAESVQRSRNPNAILMGQADLLAEFCEEILIRNEQKKGRPLEPLHYAFPEIGEGPCAFENRLGQAFGFEVDGSKRKAVLGLLNNELAVGPFHNELSIWLQNAEGLEAEDFGPLS